MIEGDAVVRMSRVWCYPFDQWYIQSEAWWQNAYSHMVPELIFKKSGDF